MGVKWETALGAVFWAGIIFLLLSVFNVRTLIVKAIPKQIRYALAAGIGLFISLIGFVNAKFLVPNPATIIGIGRMDAIPAFLALIIIPFTYSITQGIIWGFLSWTVIKLILGKKDELTPTLIVIDIFSILALLNH